MDTSMTNEQAKAIRLTEQEVADMMRHELLTDIGYREMLNGEEIEVGLPWLTRFANFIRSTSATAAPIAAGVVPEGMHSQILALNWVIPIGMQHYGSHAEKHAFVAGFRHARQASADLVAKHSAPASPAVATPSEHDEPTHKNHPGHHDGHTCEAMGQMLADLGSQRATVSSALDVLESKRTTAPSDAPSIPVWATLTDERIIEIAHPFWLADTYDEDPNGHFIGFARAIIAALKGGQSK